MIDSLLSIPRRLLLIAGCLLVLAIPSHAQEDRTGAVQLEDGETWSGLLVDAGWEVIVRGDEGAERRIPKHTIERLEGGDPVLWAELAIARLLGEPDEEERAKLRRVIAEHPELTREQLLEAAERPPRRAPLESGRSTQPVRVRGTELDTDYELVIPPGYDPKQAWPLWISMHGTGGRGSHCVQFLEEVAREKGFLLACPTEHESLRGQGWGYRDPERELTLSVLEDVKRRCHVDTNRVYLNGWSRGGHASYDIAMHYPGLFAGINPVIGAPRGHFFGMLRNLSSMGVTIINGALDDALLVHSARRAVETLRKRVDMEVEYQEDPDRGHELFLELMPAVADELLAHERDPQPENILLAGYELREVQLAWLRLDELDEKAYAPGKAVRIRGIRDSWSDERKLEGLQRGVFNQTAWAEATRREAYFSLKTELVTKLTIRIPASYEGDRRVRLKVNGKTVFHEEVEREARYLLEDLEKHRDRKQLYWNEVTVEVE